MKTITGLAILLLFFMGTMKAQSKWSNNPDLTVSNTDVVDENGLPVQLKQAPKFVGRVMGVVGTSYSSGDLKNLATRNVNKIASLSLGVQNNYNAPPIIKGAVGGTAYYVDGVRVRSGSLGVAGVNY